MSGCMLGEDVRYLHPMYTPERGEEGGGMREGGVI